jgi:YfiH family protein
MHCDWLTPDWPAPGWVQAVLTTRAGGVSQGPFAGMNLGEHVGDDPVHVQANRTALAHALSVRPVFLQQVHGVDVIELSSDTPDGLRADAAVSQMPQLACAVMVADCLPILLTHERLPLVAALHAGWRGLAGQAGGVGATGVIEATVVALARAAGCSVAELAPGLLAWLGPCIGPSAFEVGAEVRAALSAGRPDALAHFLPAAKGKYMADLPALARQRLASLGVGRCYGNDGSPAWCTTANDSVFFSHRRSWSDCGVTGGRMAACIWLR